MSFQTKSPINELPHSAISMVKLLLASSPSVVGSVPSARVIALVNNTPFILFTILLSLSTLLSGSGLVACVDVLGLCVYPTNNGIEVTYLPGTRLLKAYFPNKSVTVVPMAGPSGRLFKSLSVYMLTVTFPIPGSPESFLPSPS